MFIGYYVHFKITEGYEEIEDPNNPKATPKSATPKDWFIALSQNKYLCFLVIADLAKWVVKFLVAAAAVYYFSYVMGTSYQTKYVTFANIMGVIGAFLCRFIAKKLGNKNTLIASYIFMIVLFLVSYFSYKNATVVFVLMLIAQMGYGIAYASSPALYADCAVYSKWKTKKDTTGFIMGLQTLPLKIGVFVRSALLNAVLGAAGYDLYSAQITEAKNAGTLAQLSETLPDTLKQGVAGAFCLWAAIFCIIGVVLLVLFYKLDNKKVLEYQAEIDAREMAK
jgi:GPH family glycoside/pentoside/hexuronide:cation symporter